MTKISMCREIIETMIFLGIPTNKFSEMKKNFGSIEEFYKFVEIKISGNV